MRRALVPAALGILLLSSTLNTGCSGGSSTPVPPPPKTLVSIAVTPVSPSIVNGTTQQFTATGNYSDGTTQNVTTSATWSSSDPTVATISSQGLATGLKAGSVTITALLDTKSGTDDLSVTSAAVPPSWAQHGPTARNSHSSVFDPASKQMIVFGGQDTASGAALNDLWLVGTGVDRHLSASSITPTNGGPSARYGHTATYDAANDRMTIFAGGSGSPLTCTNDVWVLDGATSQNGDPTWIHLTPSGGPAPRMRHNAVYDSTTNSLIVFGGSDCAGGDLNDVWVLSNANGNGGTPAWTKVTTTGPPPAPREGSSAIYDATNNVLTIYGGSSGAFIFGDILTLSNANGSGTAEWNPLLPSGVGPLGRKGHSALYDSVNNLMIVFGGVSGSTTFGDTWVLTSPNGIGGAPLWTKITATGTAPTLYFHGAAYDDAANAMYLFGGTATTSKLEISNHTFVLSKANGLTSGSNWTVSGPPVRYSQSAFVDSSNLFVFGGQHATGDINFNDYWENSGVLGTTSLNWTNVLTSVLKPAERFGHTVLYDKGSKSMMLFGGGLGFPGPCTNDYWILQHANTVGGTPTWVSVTPSGTAPSLRMNYAAAYAAASNSLILFGGFDCTSAYFNDVWVLDNANDVGTPAWTKLTPTGTPPSKRESSSAVYDPATNSLIVFGGDADFNNGSAPFGDIFVLSHANGSGGTPAWTEIIPSNNGPAARSGHSATYDPTNNAMTVYGGFDGTGILADSWVLSNANGTGTAQWTHLGATPAGPPRRWHSGVYDPVSNEMLIFGGVSAMSPLAPDANTFSLAGANGTGQ